MITRELPESIDHTGWHAASCFYSKQGLYFNSAACVPHVASVLCKVLILGNLLFEVGVQTRFHVNIDFGKEFY